MSRKTAAGMLEALRAPYISPLSFKIASAVEVLSLKPNRKLLKKAYLSRKYIILNLSPFSKTDRTEYG